MRYISLLVIFILSAASVYSQDSLGYKRLVPSHAFKFSPFHLINFYPTLEFSYEKKLTKVFTAQVEYGYILDYPGNNDESYKDKRGYKMKVELRRYFAPVVYRNLVFYGAAEFYWNDVDFDRLFSQQECFGLDCDHAIIRYSYYPVRYNEQGFSLKFGLVKYFFTNFFMDVNSGWSMRFIDYDAFMPNGVPAFPEGDVEDFMFDIPNEEDRVVPSPVLGIRIGYRFR